MHWTAGHAVLDAPGLQITLAAESEDTMVESLVDSRAGRQGETSCSALLVH